MSPFMGASTTKGAVMQSCRKPATKVVTFQWPCGTLATSRCPRRQRPRNLVMLVEVPVSSTKMSLLGSSRGCSRCQFARAVRTSARSRSDACKLFFERDVVALEEPPYRTGTGGDATCPQPGADLLKRQVRFTGNQLQQPVFVDIKRRAAAAHALGRHRSRPPKLRHPTDRRTHTHLERRCCLMTRLSALD